MSGRATNIEDRLPEPKIVLTGCQAWPPKPDPRRPDECAVCGGCIPKNDHQTYCAWNDCVGAGYAARIVAARVGLDARERHRAAQDHAKKTVGALEAKIRKGKSLLSEQTRRRVWNGYKGSLLAPRLVPEDDSRKPGERAGRWNQLAREGREFLKRIGQLPDWNLILDSRGRVIGRENDPPKLKPAEPACPATPPPAH